MLRLEEPTAGEIVFDGADVTARQPAPSMQGVRRRSR